MPACSLGRAEERPPSSHLLKKPVTIPQGSILERPGMKESSGTESGLEKGQNTDQQQEPGKTSAQAKAQARTGDTFV